MRITIDYNGTFAECKLTGCIPTASDPDVDPFKTYNFNEADKMSQIFALSAFDTIKQHWKRENSKKNDNADAK